jgi:hypothetical protein
MISKVAGGIEIHFGRSWSVVFIMTRVIGLVYLSHVSAQKHTKWMLPLWPRRWLK